MIPIVDLLNFHSSVEEEAKRDLESEGRSSAFIVGRGEKKRSERRRELILSHERNDQHFLLFYGFLPSMNPQFRS